MKKLLLLVLVTSIPFWVFATDTTTDTDTVLNQTKSVLDQYAKRIKSLEVENQFLREEMAKAGIKIPLTIFTGAMNQTSTGIVSANTWTTNPTITGSSNTAINIDAVGLYGERYGNFIKKTQNDWSWIVSAYKINTGAYIWGFEFVKQWNDNHAFIDIVYDPKAWTGIYDAKILYEYNTDTFQRKLIWLFEFDRTAWLYKTKTGNNPYPGVQRTFIANPYIKSTSPVLATSSNTGTTSVIASGSTVTLANIEKAYSDKRYLSVISLSNSYLAVNPATVDILRIRYRTYFIIGKYTESLTEIGKIEDLQLGKLDKAVACDAQVIATYSSNNTLIDKYTKLCAKK
jgi:hypothetical protein